MASKTKTSYLCENCGFRTPKWIGRCPECGEWNTLIEEVIQPAPSARQSSGFANSAAPVSIQDVSIQRLNDISTVDEPRYKTGISELDRVLGGGIVKGSLVLLGGDPGIGKSTLLLQICGDLCRNLKVMYFSGEESSRQIKMRADRLTVDAEDLYLVSQNNMDQILEVIRQHHPDVVIIDSIQTMSLGRVSSSPGSVTQVRECTHELMRLAKEEEIAILIIGHVNKDGAIAGPKVLEHIVDAVLYFEGDRNLSYRILRAVKNRFGSTNEIGMFEMRSKGLDQVENPSMLLLEDRPKAVSGNCVACVMEGSRPILSEIQALVAKTGFPAPRRTSNGFDYNRTCLLIAVLERRAGFFFGNLDVYINVVGGLKLDEPSADLPVLLALYSGLRDQAIPDDLIAFGEVGLSGEVRAVPNALPRILEAKKLGFRHCILPKHCYHQIKEDLPAGIHAIPVASIKEAFATLKELQKV